MKPDWRVVYRLSGTGSVGATVRVYYEKVSKENINQSNAEALQDIINWSLDFSDINNVLQRQGPTVIT